MCGETKKIEKAVSAEAPKKTPKLVLAENIGKREPVVGLKLIERFGSLVLVAVDEDGGVADQGHLLKINQDGLVTRYTAVNPDFGFNLDNRGRLKDFAPLEEPTPVAEPSEPVPGLNKFLEENPGFKYALSSIINLKWSTDDIALAMGVMQGSGFTTIDAVKAYAKEYEVFFPEYFEKAPVPKYEELRLDSGKTLRLALMGYGDSVRVVAVHEDGSRVPRSNIVSINSQGYLSRHYAVNGDVGLQLDDEGLIKISE